MGLAGVKWRALVRSPRAYAVCVAVMMLAGCGSAVAPQSDSRVTTGAGVVLMDPPVNSSPTVPANIPAAIPADIPADFWVERRTWGGMCAAGPCGTLLVIPASGAWVLHSDGKITQGALSRQQVEVLVRSARVTQLHLAAGTSDCAANHDGTSVGYAWTVGGVTRSMTSCEHPINPSDPLVVELQRIADAITP